MERNIVKLLVLCSLVVRFVNAFPESGDPITEEPPLYRPDTAATKVVIFENAACSSWDLVLQSQYVPPSPWKSWSKVILDFSASENGTQYDRYGAFWIGNVEILRTTTAEPTADGIVWRVEKDVTSYLQWFQSEQTAYLSIPNNIDSTYTGIPLVNISLTFYAADESNPPAEGIPEIMPLSSAPGNWNAIEVTAGSNLTYTTTLPYNDVVGVTLELLASPHACEEFWYTNIDNNDAADKFGLCGGGVYRELQVYVDGVLAGATYPMIVVYTGGINPFLWRPLTGIMSFDIPAYSFDLTPFVLGDGAAHTITVKVLGGDSQGGMWYLDSALKLYRDASAAPVSGGLVEHRDSGSNITTISGQVADGYSWNTTGTHTYAVRGRLVRATGTAAQSTVNVATTGRLEAWDSNLLSDEGSVETTNGASYSWHTDALAAVLPHAAHRLVESVAVYPYSMVSSYTQDATTMDMSATVDITYSRTNVYSTAPATANAPEGMIYNISWRNNIVSSAAYNRTLDHTTVYVESDIAAAGYFVGTTTETCYQRLVDAEGGYVGTDSQEGECNFPGGKYICGYELCEGGDGNHGSRGAVVKVKEVYLPKIEGDPTSMVRTTSAPKDVFPVRHPLMGRAKLAVERPGK